MYLVVLSVVFPLLALPAYRKPSKSRIEKQYIKAGNGAYPATSILADLVGSLL
jgi:hypothetical protein